MKAIDLSLDYKERLFSVALFSDLSDSQKESLWESVNCSLISYEARETVACQGDPCGYLYVLLEGILVGSMIDRMGTLIKIEEVVAPRSFATPHLFGNTLLSATFVAKCDSVVFRATKNSFFHAISENALLLSNFFKTAGNCDKCSTVRLQVLSYKQVRSRFIAYLMYHRVGSDTIRLDHNINQLSAYLNVTRPALSKEISRLINEGLITFDKRTIQLLDIPKLSRYI